ncbi:MAG: hypothetical protein AAGA90_09770 [Actinomycetota bacterium]
MNPDAALARFVLAPDLDDDARLMLWRIWADAGDIDDHSTAAYDLFPAVYAALRDLDVDHPWLPRLKGVYRQAWTRNTLQRRTVGEAATILDDAGLDHLHLRSWADSPEHDLPLNQPTPRVVVRWEDAGRARDALVDAGWTPGERAAGGLGHRGVLQRYDQPFDPPESGATIRLTDHATPGESGRERSAAAWARAVPVGRGRAHQLHLDDRIRSFVSAQGTAADSMGWMIELTNALRDLDGTAATTLPTAAESATAARERIAIYAEITGDHIDVHDAETEPDPPGVLSLAREEWRAARRLGLGPSAIARHTPTLARYGLARARRRAGRVRRRLFSPAPAGGGGAPAAP